MIEWKLTYALRWICFRPESAISRSDSEVLKTKQRSPTSAWPLFKLVPRRKNSSTSRNHGHDIKINRPATESRLTTLKWNVALLQHRLQGSPLNDCICIHCGGNRNSPLSSPHSPSGAHVDTDSKRPSLNRSPAWADRWNRFNFDPHHINSH